MKKIFILIFVTICVSSFAQLPVPNGFYRTKNTITNRYVTVIDGYGRIDVGSTSADLGAIRTYRLNDTKPRWNEEKVISNPASIIYSEYKPQGYSLFCQGTSTFGMTGAYFQLTNRNNSYQLYASRAGLTLYLHDIENNKDSSDVATSSKSGAYNCYKDWTILPLSTDGDNYFGMLPTINNGGSYYLSFYASFPFSFHSSGMTAYYITKVDPQLKVAVIKEIGANKTDIAGATPLIVKCSSARPTDNRLNIHTSSAVAPTDNLLQGVYFARKERQSTNPHQSIVVNDTATMRVLGTLADGTIGMKKTDWAYMPKNTAYLKVNPGTPAELKLVTPEEYEKMKNVKATSISIDKTEITNAEVGQQIQLNATILPDNTTNKTVSWSSSNETIATVNASGLVTILTEGNVTITAKTNDGTNLSATCKITIPHKEIKVTSITLNITNISKAEVGDWIQLYATVTPDNADRKNVEWSSSNEDVAYVTEDGLVIITGEGDVIISAKTTDGTNLVATCTIHVPHVEVLLGDANGDGTVDVSDITAIASYILGRSPSNFVKRNADVNEDGYIDVSDITGTAAIILGTDVIPGDANDDEIVDVSDITAIASHILGKDPLFFNPKNADANRDGAIDISDITTTAGIILGR